MTEYVPPFPPDDSVPQTSEPALGPTGEGAAPVTNVPPQRLPFSRTAIWGFVISCVSIFVFGFIGALGAALSARGFRAARQGTARGRGLAIAGMIIGAVGFLYYAISFIIRATA